MKQFVSVWQIITSDYFILSAVKGVKIEFSTYPKQTIIPLEYNFNKTEVIIIENQKEKFLFLDKGVFDKTTHPKGEYTSNILIRPNKDVPYRLTLNLRYTNEFGNTTILKWKI